MITKEELLTCSINKFTQFGSKHVSLDEIASTLGISKKTIYTFFKNKEDLVTSSLEQLLNEFSEEIDRLISDNKEDPIISVILIYKRGFEYLKYFKPSFIFGLKKYYPKASNFFEKFNEDLANKRIYNLLKQAQEAGNIKQEVNLELVVKIYFLRLDTVLFNNNNLFKLHHKEELFKHMVVYNLRGIITRNYSNTIFE